MASRALVCVDGQHNAPGATTIRGRFNNSIDNIAYRKVELPDNFSPSRARRSGFGGSDSPNAYTWTRATRRGTSAVDLARLSFANIAYSEVEPAVESSLVVAQRRVFGAPRGRERR